MSVWLKFGFVLTSPESGNMLVFPAPMSFSVTDQGVKVVFWVFWVFWAGVLRVLQMFLSLGVV